MQRKTISLIVAGSGVIKDLAISPETTVHDIINQNGLSGYALSKGNEQSLSQEDNIFNSVMDGDEVYASPEDVSVGRQPPASPFGGKPSFQFEKITGIRQTVTHSGVTETRKVEVVRTRTYDKTLFLKKRSGLPYWMKAGWFQTNDGYNGWYRTKYGSWKGYIHRDYQDSYSYFIIDPPSEVKNGSHGACFSHRGNGKYQVHFSVKPTDIGDGILTVERLISESFGQKNHKAHRGGFISCLRKLGLL
ncbi:hypothetical protein HZA73_09585 [candidate division TA06 bacterium]|nr:hypothetical protein [candidate division TA06 bacterium]